ncbi:centrosomal protein of 97 kDa-like isoform X2 [Gordionus sp. m RMFG-2023]|uniref:centrosomal protein of 97 kDa-like isoform X2 n=1 Tax=Gordionus sp. m RMFG-2023 TaxID=3053472 RepID=UPI0031FC27AF
MLLQQLKIFGFGSSGGLKTLINLVSLNLSHNHIKKLGNLSANQNLSSLNLAHNEIFHIANISSLNKLKDIDLSYNKLKSLSNIPCYLPRSILVLKLAHNCLEDLTHVYHLSYLLSLRELSILGNPCVSFSDTRVLTKPRNFDYRPYVLSWCTKLKILDNQSTSETESLKAEWLYSQGKVSNFRIGEHANLVIYLIKHCPLNPEDDISSSTSLDENKLKTVLIHQKLFVSQLDEENRRKPINANNIPDSQLKNNRPELSKIMSKSYHSYTNNSPGSRNNNNIFNESSLNSYKGKNDNNIYRVKEKFSEQTRILMNNINRNASNNQHCKSPITSPTKFEMNGIRGYSNIPGSAHKITIPIQSTKARYIIPIQTDNESNENTDTSLTARISNNASISRLKNEQTNHSIQTYQNSPDSHKTEYKLSNSYGSHRSSSSPSKPGVKKFELNKKYEKTSNAATKIQAWWRGHRLRHNPSITQKLQCMRMRRIEEHIFNIHAQIKLRNEEKKLEKEMRETQFNMLQIMWDEIKDLKKSIENLGSLICEDVDKNRKLNIIFNQNSAKNEIIRPSTSTAETFILASPTKNQVQPLDSHTNVNLLFKIDEPSKLSENALNDSPFLPTASIGKNSESQTIVNTPLKTSDQPKISMNLNTTKDNNYSENQLNEVDTSHINKPGFDEIVVNNAFDDVDSTQATLEQDTMEDPLLADLNELENKVMNYEKLTEDERSYLLNNVSSTIMSLQENLAKCLTAEKTPSPLPNLNTNASSTEGTGDKQVRHERNKKRGGKTLSLDRALELVENSTDDHLQWPIKYPKIYDYLTKYDPKISVSATDGSKIEKTKEGELTKIIDNSQEVDNNNDLHKERDEEEVRVVNEITDDIVNSILLKAIKKYNDTKAHRSLSARAGRFFDIDLTKL